MERAHDNPVKFELLWRTAGGQPRRELFRSFRRAERKQRALLYHSAARDVVLRVVQKPRLVQTPVAPQPAAAPNPVLQPRPVRLLIRLGRWPVRFRAAGAGALA